MAKTRSAKSRAKTVSHPSAAKIVVKRSNSSKHQGNENVLEIIEDISSSTSKKAAVKKATTPKAVKKSPVEGWFNFL